MSKIATNGIKANVAFDEKDLNAIYASAGAGNLDAVMQSIEKNQNKYGNYEGRAYRADKEKERYAQEISGQRTAAAGIKAGEGAAAAQTALDNFLAGFRGRDNNDWQYNAKHQSMQKVEGGKFNPEKVTAGELEILRLKATDSSLTGDDKKNAEMAYQRALDHNENVDEYNRLQESVNNSMEIWAERLAAAAENFKGEAKVDAQALAEAIKNGLASGDSNAFMAKELVDAIEKANKANSKDMKKVLEDIIKELKKPKD